MGKARLDQLTIETRAIRAEQELSGHLGAGNP